MEQDDAVRWHKFATELMPASAVAISTQWAPGLTRVLISARRRFMLSVLAAGVTIAAPIPGTGKMATKQVGVSW